MCGRKQRVSTALPQITAFCIFTFQLIRGTEKSCNVSSVGNKVISSFQEKSCFGSLSFGLHWTETSNTSTGIQPSFTGQSSIS